MVVKENSVAALCSELIKVHSLSGQESEVVQRARLFWESHRLGSFETDKYGSFTATLEGNKPGKTILFDAHMDTVPADPSLWREDPWSGEIRDGRVYGRGTSDMKGALAAMLVGASEFAKSTGGNFAGKVCVAGVVHEECFEGIAARAVSEAVKPDLVVIGEASRLNLKIGQRGRAEIIVETFGVNAHSANPEKGRNAVYDMAKVIEAIRLLSPLEQEELGKGILELTDIKSDPYPGASVVPDYCRVTYDRRLLKGETPHSVLSPIREAVGTLLSDDPSMKVKVSLSRGKESCYTGNSIEGERFFPAWYFDPQEDFILTALKGLRSAGLEPEITTYAFCTNGSHYAGEAGIPTIGFGPSRENLAHTVDEYIEIEQLEKACLGYQGIMKCFLGS